MIDALAIAFAVGAGIGWPRVALIAAAMYWPLPTLGLIALVRAKVGVKRPSAVGFCDGVSAELRAGSSLRSAVVASAAAAGAEDAARAGRTGAPIEDVARLTGAVFPDVGEEIALVVRELAFSGSGGADLFDELGSLALAKQEVAREVRIASAPARATAALFVGGPSLYLLAQARSGSLSALLASPGQRFAAVAGLSLFFAGLAMALVILWRAR